MSKEEQAKQFYVFWHKMLGYPGISNAKKLIRKFTHYHKFEWGKYYGSFVADIIMLDRQYIQWCIDNYPRFKMSEEERYLFAAGKDGYSVGGYKTEIIGDSCYSYSVKGDSYDSDFIDAELAKME